jgi:hypothetical protein
MQGLDQAFAGLNDMLVGWERHTDTEYKNYPFRLRYENEEER